MNLQIRYNNLLEQEIFTETGKNFPVFLLINR